MMATGNTSPITFARTGGREDLAEKSIPAVIAVRQTNAARQRVVPALTSERRLVTEPITRGTVPMESSPRSGHS